MGGRAPAANLPLRALGAIVFGCVSVSGEEWGEVDNVMFKNLALKKQTRYEETR